MKWIDINIPGATNLYTSCDTSLVQVYEKSGFFNVRPLFNAFYYPSYAHDMRPGLRK
jgi:hypothetical protein